MRLSSRHFDIGTVRNTTLASLPPAGPLAACGGSGTASANKVAAPERRRVAPSQGAINTQARLAHLEQVIVRQHRFVNDVAHELRTPLTAQCVVAESVLGRHAATTAQLRDAIVSMLEESKHMKRLIEGLQDLTRASLTNTAEQDVSRQSVALDLSALTRDCVESLRVLADEKQQNIEVSATPGVLVDVDLTMARQALLNVIHNAIEHCPEGTHIRVDTTCCSPNEASIRVRDNGPGIALEDQCHVFERFYRGARTSRKRSLGLGLSIAKALLCSQGGGIQLQSTPGEGCCFLLSLPLAAAPAGGNRMQHDALTGLLDRRYALGQDGKVMDEKSATPTAFESLSVYYDYFDALIASRRQSPRDDSGPMPKT